MSRKFFVGGNWKMNGTKSSIDEICSWLVAGPLDPNTEVGRYSILYKTLPSNSILFGRIIIPFQARHKMIKKKS